MLAPPNDFGYSHGGYDHHHSGERPKIFMDSHGHGGAMHPGQMHGHPGMGEYTQHMAHAMTPQHHHHQGEFDHEPLMMNMHNPQSHFYPPMGAQMLHVSADYPSSMDGTTPSNRTNGSSKRSREDLNLKEKKRMFKLNDRINQLKDLLDEAGVQSKKNKQSILDNTYHYVGMLRSNLLIAKQKAERAEKQAETFRNQAQKGGVGISDSDQVFKRCFMQSSTPRLVVDATTLEPVTFNQAFVHYTGLSDDMLKGKANVANLRASLCLDNGKLDTILKHVRDGKPTSAVVQARHANGIASLTLMVSAMADDMRKVANVEFSLIPLEISSNPAAYNAGVKDESQQEASPSSVNELAL